MKWYVVAELPNGKDPLISCVNAPNFKKHSDAVKEAERMNAPEYDTTINVYVVLSEVYCRLVGLLPPLKKGELK